MSIRKYKSDNCSYGSAWTCGITYKQFNEMQQAMGEMEISQKSNLLANLFLRLREQDEKRRLAQAVEATEEPEPVVDPAEPTPIK